MSSPIDVSELSTNNPWEQRDHIGLANAIVATVKIVLLKPKEFFDNLEIKESIKDPFLFYLFLSIPISSLSLVLQHFFPMGVVLPQPLSIQVVMIAFWIPAGIFVGAGILHLFVKMYGGTGGYKGTFNIMAYGTATALFVLIPYLGSFVATVWGIVVTITGYQSIHKLSTGKALLAYFSLFIIVAVLVALAIALPVILAHKPLPE